MGTGFKTSHAQHTVGYLPVVLGESTTDPSLHALALLGTTFVALIGVHSAEQVPCCAQSSTVLQRPFIPHWTQIATPKPALKNSRENHRTGGN